MTNDKASGDLVERIEHIAALISDEYRTNSDGILLNEHDLAKKVIEALGYTSLRAQLAAAEAELQVQRDSQISAVNQMLAAEAQLQAATKAMEENEEYWKAAHDLIENARETVRLKIVYDKRPPGLFQDLQNALYICRGRNVEALHSLKPDGGGKQT